MAPQSDASFHGFSAPRKGPAACLGGQPLATLAPAVLHHAHAAPGAHPAQEAVHAAAISLLGLEGSLDGGPLEESTTGENRGSVPEARRCDLDSAHVTSSADLQALRCPQGFATLPARKQPGKGSGIDPVQIAPLRTTHHYN
jgi:hypothetical protein